MAHQRFDGTRYPKFGESNHIQTNTLFSVWLSIRETLRNCDTQPVKNSTCQCEETSRRVFVVSLNLETIHISSPQHVNLSHLLACTIPSCNQHCDFGSPPLGPETSPGHSPPTLPNLIQYVQYLFPTRISQMSHPSTLSATDAPLPAPLHWLLSRLLMGDVGGPGTAEPDLGGTRRRRTRCSVTAPWRRGALSRREGPAASCGCDR